jgi:hypothetical protein
LSSHQPAAAGWPHAQVLASEIICGTVWAWELLRCGGHTCHGLHERLRNVDCTTPLACALLPLLLLWWWLQATCPASGSSCATLTSQAPTCSCLESALRCVDFTTQLAQQWLTAAPSARSAAEAIQVASLCTPRGGMLCARSCLHAFLQPGCQDVSGMAFFLAHRLYGMQLTRCPCANAWSDCFDCCLCPALPAATLSCYAVLCCRS